MLELLEGKELPGVTAVSSRLNQDFDFPLQKQQRLEWFSSHSRETFEILFLNLAVFSQRFGNFWVHFPPAHGEYLFLIPCVSDPPQGCEDSFREQERDVASNGFSVSFAVDGSNECWKFSGFSFHCRARLNGKMILSSDIFQALPLREHIILAVASSAKSRQEKNPSEIYLTYRVGSPKNFFITPVIPIPGKMFKGMNRRRQTYFRITSPSRTMITVLVRSFIRAMGRITDTLKIFISQSPVPRTFRFLNEYVLISDWWNLLVAA